MATTRGVTLVELVVVLAILAAGAGATVTIGRALPRYRVTGVAADLYGALHLTRGLARATGVMHALVLDRDGGGFRIVEDPAGDARTVMTRRLIEGAVASGNSTIRFSPKGFAVPFGTITVRAEGEVRRLVVNILGRIRVEDRSLSQ